MRTRVRRWVNGLAVRLNKKGLRLAGVSKGDSILVEVKKAGGSGVPNLGGLPTFKDNDSKASQKHDEYLYG